MRTRFLGAACAYVLMLAAPTSVSAALVSRLGGQGVYDTVLNVTWLADASLAASNTFGVSGIGISEGIIPVGAMTWTTAQSWIGAMNTANYPGHNDWRHDPA